MFSLLEEKIVRANRTLTTAMNVINDLQFEILRMQPGLRAEVLSVPAITGSS